MASLTPTFNGAYDGHMINNMTNFVIDSFDKYIEEINIIYRPVYDYNLTGFETVVYLLNSNTVSNIVADVNIILVGDLPIQIMRQFMQLSKGTLGAGMDLTFIDDIATDRTYIGKWSNAADFVENSELLCGGELFLKCYNIYDTE